MRRREFYMRRAISLAMKGVGKTSPNPAVGAVVVKGGRILGEGYHRKVGLAHAEVIALNKAGERAKGADLYVTLEPCCLQGRTPPCTEKIIKSGVRRVFFGMIDPNPDVKGRGLKILRDSGLEVIGPICESECRDLNRPYIKWVTKGLPYVIVKIALTMDGRIADSRGDSKWISNGLARRYVHHIRSLVDAVAVGYGTARRDKPRLNVRLPGYRGRQPVPLIVGKKENDRVNLGRFLKACARKGITSLLVEGGSRLHTSLIKGGFADYLIAFVAPKILGGCSKVWLGDIGVRRMKDVKKLHVERIFTLGDNVVIEGRF